MFRSVALPFIALLTFAAFMCGVFFQGFDQPLFAPALLCVYALGLTVLGTGYRGGWAFPSTATAGFLLVFWLWLGVSLFWSDVPYISTIFTMIVGALPMLYFAVTSHPDRDCVIGAMTVGVCAGAALLGLWALTQFVFLSDLIGPRISHPMLNPNNLAVLLVMAVFPFLGAVCLGPTKFKPVMAVLALALFAAAITTQSRGALSGLLIGLVFFAFFGWPKIRQNWKYFLVLGCAAVLAACVTTWAIMLHAGQVHFAGGGTAGQSVEVRFMLWDSGLRMLKDDLFSPVGLGNFFLAFPAYRHFGDISDGYFLHVDPLQFAIETGLPALFLFYGFSIAVLVRTVRALRTANPGQRLSILFPFCSLIGLMANAHLNFDLYMLPAILFGAVMLCAWHRATETVPGGKTFFVSFRGRGGFILAPVLIILFVVSPVWLARAGYAVMQAEKVPGLMAEMDHDGAREAIDRAMRFGPENYYRTDFLDGLWYAVSFNVPDKGSSDAFTKAEAGFNRSIEKNPYNSFTLVQKALLHFLHSPEGKEAGRAEAKEILLDVLRIDPTSTDARIGLSNILDLEGKTDEAIKVLEDGYQWEIVRKYAPLAYRDALIKLYVKKGTDKAVTDKMALDTYKIVTDRQKQINQRQRLDRWIDEKIGSITGGSGSQE